VAARVVSGREVFVGEEVQRRRLEVCESNACGRYAAEKGRCAECGCFVSAKAKLAGEECPRRLWGGEEVVDAGAAAAPEVRPELAEVSETPATATCAAPEAEETTMQVVAPAVARVVVFSSQECPACRGVEALLAEVEQLRGEAVAVEYVEVATGDVRAVEMGVVATPTLLVYREGRFVGRFEGLPEVEVLARAVGGEAPPRPTRAPREQTPREAPATSKAYENRDAPPESLPTPRRSWGLEVDQAQAELSYLTRHTAHRGYPRSQEHER
jgi:thiol-disulfide isomerase/thioredoxin